MAFAGSGLVLLDHGADKKFWRYDSSTDAMATIETAGYFANTTSAASRLSVGDTIIVFASNGQKWLRVTVISAAGAITTAGVFGDMGTTLVTTTSTTVFNTPSTATELPISGALSLATTSTAAGLWVLNGPYPGADLKVHSLTSAPITLRLSTSGGAATWDGTNDDALFTQVGQTLHAVGLSTLRMGIIANSTEGGSTIPITFG